MKQAGLPLSDHDVSLEIIEFIASKRVSTANLSDCLRETTVLKGVAPLSANEFSVGFVRLAIAVDGNNWDMHRALESVKARDVVVIEALNCDECAVAGELVARFCIDQREAKALIVNGNVRDSEFLRGSGYPVWCSGVTPVGAENSVPALIDCAPLSAMRLFYDGAIAVCDDSGVLIIPRFEQTEMLIKSLHQIVEKERAWFESIVEKGMTTYQVVCKAES